MVEVIRVTFCLYIQHKGNNCVCNDSTVDIFGESLGWLLNCINGSVVLNSRFCVTSCNSSTTNEALVGGMCPFIQLQRRDVIINPNMDYADITAESCGPANRTGTLCGRCDDGFSVAITDPYMFGINVAVVAAPCTLTIYLVHGVLSYNCSIELMYRKTV